MGTTIGDLLPLALGVGISPVPIIAVILMLLAPRARATSVGFLVGWVAGIVVVSVVFVLLASTLGGDSSDEPSAATSWIQLIIGVGLIALGFRQWGTRPAVGEPAKLPRWMSAIDSFTPGKALGLAFVLAAVNPKNLLMAVAAGTTIGSAGLSTGQVVVCVAVFVVLAASTVAVPVVAYLLAAERMRRPLDELKGWLQQNNVTVMAVLLLVIGVALLGKGLGGLLPN
jgi:threonine/homoserine/homoserine lactone efflux protein